MSNDGGRKRHVDYKLRADLVMLGLIEERDLNTAAEKRAIGAEIGEAWKLAAPLVKLRDAEALNRLINKIQSKQRELPMKAYWLTKAAEEYLIKGKVTVVR
jgi:hypothetical protein